MTLQFWKLSNTKFSFKILANNNRWRCELVRRDKSSFCFFSEVPLILEEMFFYRHCEALMSKLKLVTFPGQWLQLLRYLQLRPPCGTCHLFPIQNAGKQGPGTHYFYHKHNENI